MFAHDPAQNWTLEQQGSPPYTIRVNLHASPGNSVVLTGALFSLIANHRDKFWVQVNTAAPEIWEHNPWIVPRRGKSFGFTLKLSFIQAAERPVHYMQILADQIGEKLGVPNPLRTTRPRLYLSEEEADGELPYDGPVAVLVAGHKSDMPLKAIPPDVAQRVADYLNARGFVVVQVGKAVDTHPRIPGTVDLIGKTNVRQLMTLIAKSNLVVCGVTLTHHIAGAFGIPTVCCNYREPSHLIQYPTAHVLSPVGCLPCVEEGACWASQFSDCTFRQDDGRPTCHVALDPIPAIEQIIEYGRYALPIIHNA